MDGRQTKATTMIRLAIVWMTLASSGCVGLISHLGYWSGGGLVSAAYDDLSGKRVAVVCVSDTASYGAGGEADTLARLVGISLSENVPEIEVVSHSEIADWDDKHDWDQLDYRDVGRGVKADRVVAIDLEGFQLHQDPSLYKGRATVSITVLDMHKNGQEVFHRSLSDISYPVNGFYQTTETAEYKFRRVFLDVIARRVATHFFSYDPLEEFGPDPAGIR